MQTFRFQLMMIALWIEKKTLALAITHPYTKNHKNIPNFMEKINN